MATLVHKTEPVDQPAWDIQRDAFAPPPTRRIVRGWDRTPVRARAPRLHGQKVWKKVDLRSANIRDAQDEVQEELEKEGAGARKKSRMLISRENINDAMWADMVPTESIKDVRSSFTSSGEDQENLDRLAAPSLDGSSTGIEIPLSHNDDTPHIAKLDSNIAVLQFIPRKRTNTNHVITPKKCLRQTVLGHKEHAPSSVNEMLGSVTTRTMRPRKSLRKSLVPSISEDASLPIDTSEALTRLSTSAMSLPNIEQASSSREELGVQVGEFKRKRRLLRRSTNSKMRSVTDVEQALGIEHTTLQVTELSPQDTNEPVVSMPVNSNTSAENIIPTIPEGNPVIGVTIERENINLDAAIEAEQPVCLLDPATDAELTEAVGLKPLGLSSQDGEVIVQAHVARTAEDAPYSGEMRHTEPVVGHESQPSLSSDIANTAKFSMPEEQLTACQNAISAVTVSLTEKANLPVPAGIVSLLESGREPPQTQTTLSSETSVELDINQDLRSVEASDIPDSNNLATAYDHDDTDMLRNFLTRVKANKAAKNPPKRKRSLPHSPLRIPLGDLDNNASPSPLQLQKENAHPVVEPSPSKRKKKSSPLAQCESEPEPRRSGRTKPPVKELPGAPSFIPVRRLGQDLDTTITLKRNEEKELAALTRVNTRKNKGNALTAPEVLSRKTEEKEDPFMRQRLLKEVFDEKMEKGRKDKEKKSREKKSVAWAEELAQFQTLTKVKSEEGKDDKEAEKVVVIHSAEDKKHGAVRVGVRSKAAVGISLNGTPAPKRKMRGCI